MAEFCGMLEDHRKILRKNYDGLCQDLQADQLLPKLISILSPDDEEIIRAEPTERKRAEKMLGILPKRGEDAFEAFLRALYSVQKWLAERLAEEAGIDINQFATHENSSSYGMSNVHRDVLRRYANYLKPTLNVRRMVAELNQRSVLDEDSAKLILSEETPQAKVGKLLEILPKRGPNAFEEFYSCMQSVQLQFAHEFKSKVEGTHPNAFKAMVNTGISHQESDKSASSNVGLITIPMPSSSYSMQFTLFSPCSELPEEVTKLLQDRLDPPDELFGSDWKMLYKKLKLPEGKEELMTKRGGSPTNNVMKCWIQAEGKKATIKVLLLVLWDNHRRDLVEEIEKILQVEFEVPNDTSGQDAIDSMGALSIHNRKPVRFVQDIPDNLRPTFIERLSVFNLEILGKIATSITRKRCYARDAADLLEKIKTHKTRLLFKELKNADMELAKVMREILPPGSTGPLKSSDDTRANEMQYMERCKITKKLTASGEWQIVAGHVGLKVDDIKVLQQRSREPAEDVLSYWEVRSGTTVGTLYDLLVDCGLYSVADDL